MGSQKAVGGDQPLSLADGTADDYSAAVLKYLDVEAFFLAVGMVMVLTLAEYLIFGLQISDDKHYYLSYLRIGEITLALVLQGAEAVYAVFLKYFEKLKLCPRKLGLYCVGLTHKRDVDVRAGAGQHEKIPSKKYILTNGVDMASGTNDTGDLKSYLIVAAVYYLQLTFAAGTFQLHHVGGERKNTYRAHYSRAAMGAAVCQGGLFCFQYHSR